MVDGVSALTRTQGRPTAVSTAAGDVLFSAKVLQAHGQRCTVRDMTHEVRAEPPDHRTGSAGVETGEACQRTLHSLQLPGVAGRGERVCVWWWGAGEVGVCGEELDVCVEEKKDHHEGGYSLRDGGRGHSQGLQFD